MDPSSLINTNGSSFGIFTEIWPFQLLNTSSNGALGESGRVNSHFVGENTSGFNGMEQRRGSGGERKRRDAVNSENVSTSSGNEMINDDVKRLKVSGLGDENGDSKVEVEESSGGGNKPAEQGTKTSEPPKLDYIHVRARRGQATDSHSLAERARREKISERMKILQDLVPGCNKVIGKALVLDEIINYIQSLQNQVEFLSMKLEAVNSRPNSTIEGFPPKDFGAQTFDTTEMTFASQATREYEQRSSQDWLHMQVGGSFETAP
ncbi:hypothetical protein GIB67_005828 [Kingdonia uniflora]|uniref:BHLH domain-containing protein n=1 Tax=Kingdonia uniflora TaxID=39325 RepID=A0A7J7LUI3_9MAGN|nr:hypothetical protein GIB67_005828 [Kingdonia uniflora]